MKWSQATEVGLVRKTNEDSICIIPELAFFAVADGMGGHKSGEVASNMALVALAEKIRNSNISNVTDRLLEGVQQANSDIYNSSRQKEDNQGMGTTLTAILIKDNGLTVAHVGDSRAYLIRSGSITPLTQDHSLVQEMLRQGGITKEQAKEHPQRNVLTRALGIESSVDVDLNRFELLSGDIVVLCTDGLYNLVSDKVIMELVLAANKPGQSVRDLVNEALKAGGTDNISVIVVEIND